MNLELLKKEIPYQWRVQSFSKFNATASCVAYIDARDVMDLLDEAVGAGNWQDVYYSEKGLLFSKIGIKIGDEWVWKSDAGAATDIEAEKGEASDAFKRAAVKWGVGRFLYALKLVKVNTDGAKTDSHKWPKVIDEQGKPIYDITAYVNGLKGNAAPSALTPRVEPSVPSQTPAQQMRKSMNMANPDKMNCPDCGKMMYDNRSVADGGKGKYPKTNPKQPDWKCSDKACGKAVWLEGIEGVEPDERLMN